MAGDKPLRKMYMKLFRYIGGVNADSAEIRMRAPVVKTRRVKPGKVEDVEMCFWAGNLKKGADLPKPIEEGVYLTDTKAMDVYARYDTNNS